MIAGPSSQLPDDGMIWYVVNGSVTSRAEEASGMGGWNGRRWYTSGPARHKLVYCRPRPRLMAGSPAGTGEVRRWLWLVWYRTASYTYVQHMFPRVRKEKGETSSERILTDKYEHQLEPGASVGRRVVGLRGSKLRSGHVGHFSVSSATCLVFRTSSRGEGRPSAARQCRWPVAIQDQRPPASIFYFFLFLRLQINVFNQCFQVIRFITINCLNRFELITIDFLIIRLITINLSSRWTTRLKNIATQ